MTLLSRLINKPVVNAARKMSAGGASVEELAAIADRWKKISLTLVPIALVAGLANTYRIEAEEAHHPRPEPLEYPYLIQRTRQFPWGNGKRSFFHNPQKNWIPGEGYEEEQKFPGH